MPARPDRLKVVAGLLLVLRIEVIVAGFRLRFLASVLIGCCLLAACSSGGPGDTLSVFVYQAPDLSEQNVAVRPDGKISIPLVQDIRAAGTTPPYLADQIGERLRKYVRDPNVTVIVRSFVGPTSRQVRVIGEAVEPMAIPYRQGRSLLDVMIATKGLTKFTAGNRAMIIRPEPNGEDEVIHVHLGDLLNDGDMSQNVRMQPGDTLVVPQSWF